MGGSIAVDRRDKDRMIYFVDEKLLNGETIMKLNPIARQEFLEFIKNGDWMKHLSRFDHHSLSIKSFDDISVWVKYGYKSPKCPSPKKRFFAQDSSSASHQSMDFSCIETISTSGSVGQLTVYDDVPEISLFKKKELPPLLFAALLPIYTANPDFSQGPRKVKPVMRPSTPQGSDTLELFVSNEHVPPKSILSLQDWLLNASAACQTSFLDDILSNTAHSWISDYTSILKNLPLTVYLSMVNDEEVESKVVYCNCSDKVLFKERSAIGTNLHEIFSLRCSAHEADQVHRAVFGGKPLKLCLMTDACTLRALKPVHDAEGQLKYMIGIESQPFAYPVEADSFASEQPFQQVEDLLMLLPLLLKFPMYAVTKPV